MELDEVQPLGTTKSETVFSLIALLVSFLTFTGYQMHVTKAENLPSHEFLPIPFWCFMLNNVVWFILAVFYPFHHASDPKTYNIVCLLWSSCLGMIFELPIIAICAVGGPVIRNRLCTILLYVFPVMCALISVFSTIHFAPHFCLVNGIITGIIMYASPLVKIIKCHKEKSIQGLPVGLCGALVLNGLAWLVVALVYKGSTIDVYIGITNGVGALLGLLQLGIIYRLCTLSANRIHPDEGGV